MERKYLMQRNQKEVGKNNKRKQYIAIAKLYLGVKTMAKQAKTLNPVELRRVLDYVATRKHALRNRALITISMYSGMRCGEISNLLYSDVIDAEGKVRNEIRLRAEDTKTKEARTVFVSEKLQKELQQYAKVYKPKDVNVKFIYSQKEDSDGFSPNTLCQLYFNIYKGAGLQNCSSHSGRRTFATSLSSSGVSIRVLQKLLGHKNIQTTSIYVDANDDMLRKAVNLA